MKKVDTKEEEMEKRQFARLEKTLPVKFDLPALKLQQAGLSETRAPLGAFEALSRNIGAGGVFIETDLVQEQGSSLGKDTLLNLEIELLGRAQKIRPRGRIVWVSKKSRTPHKVRSGIGVKFIQLSAEEKRAISLFISQETLWQSGVVEKEMPSISREQRLTDRNRRNLEILDAIRKNRLISRAEISKNTGINIVTVSNYIDTYLKKGLVFEKGLDISTGGRRPELIEVNPHYGYVIGVDLGCLNTGFTSMQVLATDFAARLQAKAQDARADDNIEQTLPVLKNLIEQVMQDRKLQREKIRGIGIGICGIMDKFGGTVRNPLSVNILTNYMLMKKALEEDFGLPVFIENSASCALFAEKWAGISLEVKAADNIIYVFSDEQCAIMLKGELYTGSGKSAGQLNLMMPRNDSSNNSDCCWMQPSSDCLLRLHIRDFQDIPEARMLSYGARVGAKVAYLINVFNPQVVLVGRHFTRLGDAFLDTIRRAVNRWAFREAAQLVHVIPDTLGEDAVALGAASLVIETVLANI